jgi:hypothetical protein
MNEVSRDCLTERQTGLKRHFTGLKRYFCFSSRTAQRA